ncbi:MAG: diguanylate cyclase [Magnetospirillum sp.]|nr:diguanylate cyclase [Magnetospirillum sp.]
MGEFGAKVTRALTIRYVAVLGALACLAVASFLGLASVVLDAQTGAARAAVAAHQRMLVERVALAAAQLPTAADTPPLLQAMAEATEQLAAGTGHGGIDEDLARFVGHARAVAAKAGDGRLAGADRDLGRLIGDAAGPLSVRLDLIAERYHHESGERMEVLLGGHALALFGILGLIALSALGVFGPMVERLRADIAERFDAEKVLRTSEAKLWRILEESPVGVSVSRRSDGEVVFVNDRFCEIIRASRAEVIGHSARQHYVDDEQRRDVIDKLRREGRIDDAEVAFLRRDGTPFHSLLTIRGTDFQGEAVNLAWVYDISAMKTAEEKLRLAAKVVETASEAVLITNARAEIEFVNPAFTAITEYAAAEVLGQNPKMLKSGRHDADFYREMWRSLGATGRWRGEIWNRRKSGEFFAEWLSIVALKDSHGAVTHHIAVFSDITHRKEDEERVWRQANFDALTGLPNRSLFVDRLTQAVRQSRRDDMRFALMFLDLDGFKKVNDTLGHAAGDVLLQQTAVRLGECIRATDTVARLAGDEFTIILQGLRDRSDATLVAEKMLETLTRPFDIDGHRAEVRGSIGIAIFPDNAPDASSLLKMADEAMYAVKRHGKNGFRFVVAPEAAVDA